MVAQFSMAIGNGGLMQECFPKHSRTGTARIKLYKETDEEGKKRYMASIEIFKIYNSFWLKITNKPKKDAPRRMKKASSIQYGRLGYRKSGTRARVFSQIIVHGNRKI